MTRFALILSLCLGLLCGGTARAAGSTTIFNPISWWWLWSPIWKCQKWDGTACTTAEMYSPAYRQLVILPAGFTSGENAAFWTEFDRIRVQMTDPAVAGSSWSVQKRNQILFVGYFVTGGTLGSGAAFNARIAPHPIRGLALSLDQQLVFDRVTQLQGALPWIRPMSVGVLFNHTTNEDITANASPPSFIAKPYGVARFTRADLDTPYITTHEFAHGAMNFLDEYIEGGFEELNIRQLDVLTPLALFDGSWGGFVNAIADLFDVYDYNISEILANNGNVNIALSPWPATVGTSGYGSLSFPYEGGMFFGRGTYHMAGNNLMDSNGNRRAWDDGFAYAHTPAQQLTIETAFGGGPRRPNDRLRTAGPKNGWWGELGSTTTVMLYDGDKLNQFQPTQSWDVQVGWYERQWKTCWWGFVPYPCYNDVWRVAEKRVYPSHRAIDLRASSAYWLANLAQSVLCGLGVSEIPANGQSFKLCEQSLDTVATSFLPTFKFRVPYQETTVPANQWWTTYWWRFRSNNGITTGYTGWSSFYRSF